MCEVHHYMPCYINSCQVAAVKKVKPGVLYRCLLRKGIKRVKIHKYIKGSLNTAYKFLQVQSRVLFLGCLVFTSNATCGVGVVGRMGTGLSNIPDATPTKVTARPKRTIICGAESNWGRKTRLMKEATAAPAGPSGCSEGLLKRCRKLYDWESQSCSKDCLSYGPQTIEETCRIGAILSGLSFVYGQFCRGYFVWAILSGLFYIGLFCWRTENLTGGGRTCHVSGLAKRGHNVTVISAYKPKQEVNNYRTILVDGLLKETHASFKSSLLSILQ
ncbi:hypothetical protein NQ317_005133 [Molorchus minor]|uniref:Uncharacterized protein n=1 Tax=Molorchus minor TaxID=1323400 RepID=A0ABQ9JPU3_9CUCU|nr:hypothetical protein NQ317_005133 [Molorchus minor]